MIIDGHHHINGDYSQITEQMDALGIDMTVLIGVGVSDLNVITIRPSWIFHSSLILKTFGVLKARHLIRSRKFRNLLLPDPINENVLHAIKQRPDRFIGFCFINPESEKAMAELHRCLDAGMKGIKLALLQYPANLNGTPIRKICELASQRNVPIFFHQGLTHATSDPRKIISDFPNVTFIIAHAGVQHHEDAITLAFGNNNVYIDTSSYYVTTAKLKRMHRRLGAEKLVFGSDVPVMARDQNEALAKIDGLAIPGHDKERILGKNLAEILQLT